jgi:hypothetical protein
MKFNFPFLISACLLGFVGSSLAEGHRLITQGKGKLAIVEKDGEISWEMKWGGIHDIHILKNGHIMVQQNMKKVVEIDPATKKVVWTFDQFENFGNSVPNSQILDVEA